MIKRKLAYLVDAHEADRVHLADELDRVDGCLGPNNLFGDESAWVHGLETAISSIDNLIFPETLLLRTQTQIKHVQYIVDGARNKLGAILVEGYACNIVVMALLKVSNWLSQIVNVPQKYVLISSSGNKSFAAAQTM